MPRHTLKCATSQNFTLVSHSTRDSLAVKVFKKRYCVLPGQPAGHLFEHRDIDSWIGNLPGLNARLQIVDRIDVKNEIADSHHAPFGDKQGVKFSSKLAFDSGRRGSFFKCPGLQTGGLESSFQSLFRGVVRFRQRRPVRRQPQRFALSSDLALVYEPRDDCSKDLGSHLAEYLFADFFATEPERKRLASMMLGKRPRNLARRRPIALS